VLAPNDPARTHNDHVGVGLSFQTELPDLVEISECTPGRTPSRLEFSDQFPPLRGTAMASKIRVDQLLVQLGLCTSRTAAQACVLAGQVYWGERRIEKPGLPLPAEAELSVRRTARFVSRGGDKLEGALQGLQVPVHGRVCADVGASTGGFTDCLLQHGATRVYAIDVGRGQLAQRLRTDPRVVNREGENARFLVAESFPETVDLVVVDASFIGLSQLLPGLRSVLGQGGELLAMIKPQFEAGRELATRHRGVIRDAELRAEIIDRVTREVEASGFSLLGRCDSTLAGPKGNLEHFVWGRRSFAQPAEPHAVEPDAVEALCPA
jgi:23S rRNA (cytidine1920-2'-O)/16S rRNA (cytidine1409-2'-O)-methyltransferase